jgi:hypothetical protein
MVAKYQEQAEELDQTKTELEDTKLIAKQAIESLVTQNGVFLETISRLQNQVQGLKWNLKQIEGQMKQTKQMLAQQNGTIVRMQKAMGGKDRAHTHRRAANTAFDEGLQGGAGAGYEKRNHSASLGDTQIRKKHSDQQAKSKCVKLAVSEILLGACGSDSKATDIVRGILNHPKLRAALDGGLDRQWSKETVLVDADIVTELVASMDRLKKGARNSSEWHTYQSTLNAIVPANYNRPQILADRLHITYRKTKQVSLRKSLIDETQDWSIGHTTKIRKDAWIVLHGEEGIPKIGEWWLENSQVDPSHTKTRHSKVRGHHKINKNIHKRECTGPDGACVERNEHYQLMTDKAAYESFALAEPDLAEVTPIAIFVKYRPWNVVAPNQRTSMCIYHNNFKLMHEAYSKFVKEAHKECECDCTFCKGNGAGKNCASHPCESWDSMSAEVMHDGFVRVGGGHGAYYPKKCFEKVMDLACLGLLCPLVTLLALAHRIFFRCFFVLFVKGRLS